LEEGHLGCTVVMEHPVCSYAHAMEVFDPRLTSDCEVVRFYPYLRDLALLGFPSHRGAYRPLH
jgi:hypothetical protein